MLPNLGAQGCCLLAWISGSFAIPQSIGSTILAANSLALPGHPVVEYYLKIASLLTESTALCRLSFCLPVDGALRRLQQAERSFRFAISIRRCLPTAKLLRLANPIPRVWLCSETGWGASKIA